MWLYGFQITAAIIFRLTIIAKATGLIFYRCHVETRLSVPFVSILGKCVKVQRKQGLVSGSDSSNRHSPNNKRSLVPSPVAQRPLKDRIIHLLALKPYRKPELLLWLERERASPKDKADLTLVLDEVRHLAHCYINTSMHDEISPKGTRIADMLCYRGLI